MPEAIRDQQRAELRKIIWSIADDLRGSVNKVYDPCRGSGGLLLKFSKVLGDENVRGGYFGQEINLARINMFLRDIDFTRFDIALGDTLKEPQHWDDDPFDVIVSNPPYSIKWEGKNNPLNINDARFSPAGVLARAGKADPAFMMHMLSWLSAEGKIRDYLVRNNFVDTVIQLPPDLFFGATIATCIVVLKKNKTAGDVLFVDVSEQFARRDSKNRLTPENIDRIMAAVSARGGGAFSKLVANDDILANDANLSVSSYVEKKGEREEVDIAALNAEITRIVAREDELRRRIDSVVADLEG